MLGMGKSTTQAHRTYVVRTMSFMGVYVALNVAAIFGLFDTIRGTPAAWVFAAAVSAPILGQIWATLSLMRDSDEFMRALTAKQFIIAAGVAMGAFSAWGFAESYADAPHAPGWIVYVLFWAAFGLISPFIRTTR